MPTFQAESKNFVDLLQRIQDGDEICLKPGEYFGPFTIERAITIRGTGVDSVIFAVDEPALVVKVPGVRVENLVIERTVGGDIGEVVLSASPGTLPVLNQVRLRGIAENAQWEGANWDIPALLDFTEVETSSQVKRSVLLEVGTPCRVTCELGWLQVKPNYLSPGPQNLDIVLNSKGIPPGTKLSGSIKLEAPVGNKEIAIIAKIISSQVITLPSPAKEPSEIEKIPVEDWGYKFVGSAIDNFIREIEGKAALQTYQEFCDRRNRAEDLMFELVGEKPCLFYVRRKEQGQELGEEKWDLTIATDIDDAELPNLLSDRGKTLGLIAIVSQGQGLRVLSTRLLPLERGRADGFAVPFCLRLRSSYQYRIRVPQTAFARMATMPVKGELVPTEDQLQAWEAFLNIEERLAQARQFCVPFVNHNYGEATRKITFVVDANLATVDGSSENSLDKQDFWQRVNRAGNNDIKILENTAVIVRGNREGRELGTIESVEPVSNKIKVRLDAEIFDLIAEGIYKLPKTGLLSFIAFGDLVQIDRKKKALQDLKKGRSQNPYLARFLFDASQARTPKETVTLQPQDLLLKAANDGQKAAVETVLAAPDLALIQGPPGTGKTTVIAEICYQVALRGGRTLIASQANLAVDNALSRLEHNPLIRAVRKGNPSSVGPEGEPFLEDKVISMWLKNTSADCKERLSQQIETVRILRELLASTDRFIAYLIIEETFEPKQKQLQNRRAVLESNYQAKLNANAIAETQQRKVESLNTDLEALFTCASSSSVNWCQPTVINLLSHLQSYLDKETAVQNLAANVRVAINLTTEFGLVPPDLEVLSVAGWLQENVPAKLVEVQKALTEASNTATAMAEAESNQQMLRQHSASLVSLQENYQKSFAIQQSQQQEVIKLQNSKSAIGLVIIEFERWLATAWERLYVVVEKCLQERQLFTDDLIELPANLEAIAPTNNRVSWQQHLAQCQINIDKFVHKYREWDRAEEIANEIYSLISPVLNRLNPSNFPNEKAVVQAIEKLSLDGLSVISALEKLQKLALLELSILKKPLGFWGRIVEWILATAARRNWCQPSRRSKAIAILEAIIRQTPEIVQKSQPKDIESFAELATKKLVEGLSEKISFWLDREQTETEHKLQYLREQLNEQMMLVAELHKQISANQELVETARHQTEPEVNRVIKLWQKLVELHQMPGELPNLAEDYLQNPLENLSQTSQLLQQINYWENRTSQLKNLIPFLDPLAALSNVRNQIRVDLIKLTEVTQCATREFIESEKQLSEVNSQLRQQLAHLNQERTWWQEYWVTIPDRLKPTVPSTGLFDLKLLRSIEAQFNAWKQELLTAETYLSRYQSLLSDWIAKLQNPSEQDRNELRRIYLDNANVIGITCSQSANKSFSEEFKSFDVVIIDEVSKCTPPELLIPALKAKKLVLVGDHRQLPPMLDSDTLEEIAEELGSTKEELSYLEESLFKSQFEVADESIKKMLNIQYRMHPSIMGAINQFYDNKLECGLFDPDKQRQHNLVTSTIKGNHHLIWVKTPIEQGFKEQVDGTSFINLREVEIISKLCEGIENFWSDKIKQGESRKEIGIITFYGRQLKLIEDRIEPRLFPSLHIRTGTVDRFQGMERQIVIVSMVRNNEQGKVGFAKKPERVNVAFSRAQELLIIVGCHSLFTQQHGRIGSMYSNVSNVVRLHGGFVDVSDIIC